MAKSAETEMKIREHVAASMAERMAEYVAMSAQTLRKAAAGLGIKGASRSRKADLLTAIHLLLEPKIEADVRAAYAKKAEADRFADGTRVKTPEGYFGKTKGDPVFTPTGYVVTVALDNAVTPSGAADYAITDLRIENIRGESVRSQSEVLDHLKNLKEKTAEDTAPNSTKIARRTKDGVKGSKCADCGKRPIDKKTQGKDSTLCTSCYEYAGWENTHSDDAHSATNRDPQCPVCTEEFPSNGIVDMIQHKKARWVAETAKAAGWTISYEFDGAVNETTLKLSRDGADISLVWEGRLYVAKRSDFRDATGRRQLRNASAAVKAVSTPSKADHALAS